MSSKRANDTPTTEDKTMSTRASQPKPAAFKNNIYDKYLHQLEAFFMCELKPHHNREWLTKIVTLLY